MTQIGRSNRRHNVAVPGGSGARVGLAWAALSDKGYRRSVNEDSLLARSPIFAVADGMGGHTAGDFASTAVVTRLAEQVSVDFVREDAINDALRSAVDDMGRGVGHTDLGTGTTVTGLALTLVDGVPHWLVFNIGDSRVYSYLDGVLEQLTIDHSIVQELLDAGAITAGRGGSAPAQQRDHARRRLQRRSCARLLVHPDRRGNASAGLLRRAHEGADRARHPPFPPARARRRSIRRSS